MFFLKKVVGRSDEKCHGHATHGGARSEVVGVRALPTAEAVPHVRLIAFADATLRAGKAPVAPEHAARDELVAREVALDGSDEILAEHVLSATAK